MTEGLRHRSSVLVDVQHHSPRNGGMIVVDRGHFGSTIGYWHTEGKRWLLDKENEPIIDLGSPGDVTILGPTGIVWSPISLR